MKFFSLGVTAESLRAKKLKIGDFALTRSLDHLRGLFAARVKRGKGTQEKDGRDERKAPPPANKCLVAALVWVPESKFGLGLAVRSLRLLSLGLEKACLEHHLNIRK